jgi:hypothetical protein
MDTRIYTSLGRSPTSSLREDQVHVPSLECSKVLTIGGAKMVEEVVEPMLNEGQPKEKLQEPYCYGWNGRG